MGRLSNTSPCRPCTTTTSTSPRSGAISAATDSLDERSQTQSYNFEADSNPSNDDCMTDRTVQNIETQIDQVKSELVDVNVCILF